jgi:methylated-DNA-[protein]-cysteine S-methyltransferase
MKYPPTAHALYPSPLGDLLLATTARGLCGAWFTSGQKRCPQHANWGPPAPDHPVLARAARQLQDYFAGRGGRFALPLDLSGGTAFQQAVWQALRAIDAGQSRSYRQIAEAIGRPVAVRAVGAAVGANPLSIIVPCHRVLGSRDTLTGYAGGLDRKAALLRLEGWDVEAPAQGTAGTAARARRPLLT